jgi:hypothetical protein
MGIAFLISFAESLFLLQKSYCFLFVDFVSSDFGDLNVFWWSLFSIAANRYNLTSSFSVHAIFCLSFFFDLAKITVILTMNGESRYTSLVLILEEMVLILPNSVRFWWWVCCIWPFITFKYTHFVPHFFMTLIGKEC